MRITCWITEATHTHSEYVILIAIPQQQWMHERASVLRYSALPVLLVVFLVWLPYLYYKTIDYHIPEVCYVLGSCRRRHRGEVEV